MKKTVLLFLFFVFLFGFTKSAHAQDGCTPGSDACANRTGEIRNMYNTGRGCSFKCGQFTGACANSGHCTMQRIDDNLCEDTIAGNACGIAVGNTTPTQSVTSTPAVSPTASVSASLKDDQDPNPLIFYCVIAGIYIAIIYFAVGIKGQFKFFSLIGFFIIGGVVGYQLDSIETGIIVAIVLSLVLW